MKKPNLRSEVFRALARMCEPWEREVLAPLGFLTQARITQLPDNRYPQRRAALRYGTKRVLEVIADQTSYHGTKIGDRPEDRKEDLFCALQDFLNVYATTTLAPLGFLTDEHDRFPLDHPYYEMRRQFIIQAMRDIPSG
ncbi:MAG: hypothetical protein H7145_24200 [Akkermansiaceae bacterium]|nr:hypothetical protein [Armatimonadota bacterium]